MDTQKPRTLSQNAPSSNLTQERQKLYKKIAWLTSNEQYVSHQYTKKKTIKKNSKKVQPMVERSPNHGQFNHPTAATIATVFPFT